MTAPAHLRELGQAMALLVTQGYSERELRGWSAHAIHARVTDVRQVLDGMEARRLTHDLLVTAAGNGSSDALEALKEALLELTGQETAEQHMLNPDAKTDWGALRASGLVGHGGIGAAPVAGATSG